MKPGGQNTSHAVMAQRVEAPDSLDYFPTPPWATRALFIVLTSHDVPPGGSVWEPAAGGGHMAEVLCERFDQVYASDVHDYGVGYAVGSFTGEGPDVAQCPFPPDWVITNPPFNLALEFINRARDEAQHGVAVLVRTSFIEGVKRYEALFRDRPPAVFAPFVERVPMVKGRWDPDASTATSYCWLVWLNGATPRPPFWIPPGCRKSLTAGDDAARFAELGLSR